LHFQICPSGAGQFVTGTEVVTMARLLRRRRHRRAACAPVAAAPPRRALACAALTPAARSSFRAQRKSVVKITTGSASVDEVLGGGVESQARFVASRIAPAFLAC
jgi:hypothetical protein